jgi:hypothetical protein
MTHPELGGPDEINGNLVTLNALAGIPLKDIRGFRAPYLNYSSDMLTNLVKAGFAYDSSATSSIPVGQNGTDAFWPYTLDNGLANDCLTIPGICKGQPKLPGFWEVLMYAIFDERGGVGTHLMDPWIDGNNSAVYKWMQNTFIAHCRSLPSFLIFPFTAVFRQREPSALRALHAPYSYCGKPTYPFLHFLIYQGMFSADWLPWRCGPHRYN